jgi:Protein of unknown function (DUF4058)
MPSPFPGMDPYLECHWRDVHSSLVIYIRDAVQDFLPADLRARVEERVVLETPEGWANPLFPDVRVIDGRPQVQAKTTTIVRKPGAEFILLEAGPEPLTEGYIEIVDVRSGNRVVTIIEVLSPSNKVSGDDRKEYKRKQAEIVQSETNLVEIDLIRVGKHTVAIPLANLIGIKRTPYLVCVRRAGHSKAAVYPIPLYEKLPTVQVPLRPDDEDVLLDLQALIEQCYRKGRYEVDLDYRLDADPPLTGPDAEWADELLRGKGLRPAAPPKRKRQRKPPPASDGA